MPSCSQHSAQYVRVAYFSLPSSAFRQSSSILANSGTAGSKSMRSRLSRVVHAFSIAALLKPDIALAYALILSGNGPRRRSASCASLAIVQAAEGFSDNALIVRLVLSIAHSFVWPEFVLLP